MIMKKLSLLIITLLIIQTTALSQPCLPGGITFNTQMRIDNFQNSHPNCTEIEGDVEISGDDITNLNGLNVAAALLEIEHKMRKVDNFAKLDIMKTKLIKEVKRRTLDNQISTK